MMSSEISRIARTLYLQNASAGVSYVGEANSHAAVSCPFAAFNSISAIAYCDAQLTFIFSCGYLQEPSFTRESP